MNVTCTVSEHPAAHVVVHVKNDASHLVSVQVEPWALAEPLEQGEAVEIRFDAPMPGTPSIEEWSADVIFVNAQAMMCGGPYRDDGKQ